MPRVSVGKRVLFATSHNQPQWRPAICLTEGKDPTGIDLIFAEGKPNTLNCRWVFRDACRHVDDPSSRDPNYLKNIEEDNEGGLWKEDAESLEIVKLREDYLKLKASVVDLQHALANGKPKGKPAKKREEPVDEAPAPVPAVPAAVTEPDLDLVSSF